MVGAWKTLAELALCLAALVGVAYPSLGRETAETDLTRHRLPLT